MNRLLRLLLAFAFFSNAGISLTQDLSYGDDLNAEQIIELSKPALISIWMRDQEYFDYGTGNYKDTTILNGSGFIISPELNPRAGRPRQLPRDKRAPRSMQIEPA